MIENILIKCYIKFLNKHKILKIVIMCFLNWYKLTNPFYK